MLSVLFTFLKVELDIECYRLHILGTGKICDVNDDLTQVIKENNTFTRSRRNVYYLTKLQRRWDIS